MGWLRHVATLALMLSSVGVSSPHHYTIVGSTSILPFLRRSAEAWQSAHPGDTVALAGGGSVAGVVEVSQGRADIGVSDIPVRPQWTGNRELVSYPLGHLPILFIAHSGVGVSQVSHQALGEILTGKVSSWRQVGGHSVPIIVMTRPLASGALWVVSSQVLHRRRISPHAVVQLSNGAMLAAVRETPGAIGFIEAGRVPEQVQVLGVGGHQFSCQTIRAWPYYATPTLYVQKDNQGAQVLAQSIAEATYRHQYGIW